MNRRFNFGEKFSIFVEAGEGSLIDTILGGIKALKIGVGKTPEAQKPPEAVAPGPEVAAGVEAGNEIKTEAVKDRSAELRELMKGKIGEDFLAKLEVLSSLKGKSYEFAVPEDLNLLSDSVRNELVKKILGDIPNDQVEKFVEKMKETLGDKFPSGAEITPETGKDVLANLLAPFLLASANTKFTNQFKYLKDFKDSEKGKALSGTALKLKMGLDGLSKTTFDFVFDGGESVKTAFEEFQKEKKETENPQAQSPQYLEARKKNIGVLKNSLAGWLLVGLGIVKPGPDKKISDEAWGEILDGGDPFASIIIGFLSGGQLMADGGAGFTTFMDNIPKEYKGVVEKFQKQSKALSLEGKGANLEAIAKGGVEVQGTFERVDGTRFREIMKDPKNLTEKGVVLKEDVTLGATENLKLTVKDGGEVTVPKGKTLSLVGENLATAADKDTTIKDRTSELLVGVGTVIPKGTSFNGKVKLELVASSS